MVLFPIVALLITRKSVIIRLVIFWILSVAFGGVIEYLYVRPMLKFPDYQWIFQLIISIIIYVMPLSIITVSYMQFGAQLRNTIASFRNMNNANVTALQYRRAMARRVLLLPLIFAITWLPYNLVYFIASLYNPYDNKVWLPWSRFASDVVFLFYFILCPFALTNLIPHFKKFASQIFHCSFGERVK
jgi:hypothetical protein